MAEEGPESYLQVLGQPAGSESLVIGSDDLHNPDLAGSQHLLHEWFQLGTPSPSTRPETRMPVTPFGMSVNTSIMWILLSNGWPRCADPTACAMASLNSTANRVMRLPLRCGPRSSTRREATGAVPLDAPPVRPTRRVVVRARSGTRSGPCRANVRPALGRRPGSRRPT